VLEFVDRRIRKSEPPSSSWISGAWPRRRSTSEAPDPTRSPSRSTRPGPRRFRCWCERIRSFRAAW